MEIETREKYENQDGGAGTYRYWMLEIDAAEKEEASFRERAAELYEIYSAKKKTDFCILWSNVETLKPLVYGNSANPDVRNRYNTQVPVYRQIALMMERAISYSCDTYSFDRQIQNVRDEVLITGRGVARVIYGVDIVKETIDVESHDPLTGETVIVQEESERLENQELYIKFFCYEDFRMSKAKTWEDVRWIAFRHTPTREELVDQFGEVGQKVPLSYKAITTEAAERYTRDEDGDVFMRACVWEIWDKTKRERIWIADGYKGVLAKDEDPYRLENFFPMPRPAYSFNNPDSMVPTAEYEVYAKQVSVLNETNRRISAITKQLKVAGFYNAVHQEAARILSASDGQFIPITTASMDASVSEMVSFWPIQDIAAVLINLYRVRDDQIQIIYQITGLSDIIRGSTAASETATAQQIKGNFSSIRLQTRQKEIQEFIKGIYNIKAEIIAEHYTAETLQQITQLQVTPEMMQILRSDKLRNYVIDVETDSTVAQDSNEDKERRVEFLQAFGQAMQQLMPMVQAGIMPAETAKSILKFVLGGFKISRQMEEAIESIGQQVQQQPQENPQAAQEMAKIQADMQQFQAKMQADMAKMQQDAQIEMQKLAADVQIKREKIQAELQAKTQKAVIDARSREVVASMGGNNG